MIIFLPKDSNPCKLYIIIRGTLLQILQIPFYVEWENKIFSYTKESAAGIKIKDLSKHFIL